MCYSKVPKQPNKEENSTEGCANEVKHDVYTTLGYTDGNWACQKSLVAAMDKPNKNKAFSRHKGVKNKLDKSASTHNLSKKIVSSVLTLMAASVIASSRTEGEVSLAQKAIVSQTQERLTHHVHVKGRGWVRKGAKEKPMLLMQSKVDLSAYLVLKVKAPLRPERISEGYHLTDTGASICLGGKQYMRSLGISEDELIPCDMSVCGADSSNIKVLGAVLVEFKCKESPSASKQVVYICEGVAGALLSLDACIDLGLVPENFPSSSHKSTCESVSQQGKHEIVNVS